MSRDGGVNPLPLPPSAPPSPSPSPQLRSLYGGRSSQRIQPTAHCDHVVAVTDNQNKRRVGGRRRRRRRRRRLRKTCRQRWMAQSIQLVSLPRRNPHCSGDRIIQGAYPSSSLPPAPPPAPPTPRARLHPAPSAAPSLLALVKY